MPKAAVKWINTNTVSISVKIIAVATGNANVQQWLPICSCVVVCEK